MNEEILKKILEKSTLGLPMKLMDGSDVVGTLELVSLSGRDKAQPTKISLGYRSAENPNVMTRLDYRLSGKITIENPI